MYEKQVYRNYKMYKLLLFNNLWFISQFDYLKWFKIGGSWVVRREAWV